MRNSDFIMGTNCEYRLTRSFVEAVNDNLGGSGKDTAVAVVNSLGMREEFIQTLQHTKIGDFLDIVLNGTVKIVAKREDDNEVTFITMKTVH